MALINCPKCGRVISDEEEFCIHCAYPIKDLKKRNISNYETIKGKMRKYEEIILLIIFFPIFFLICAFFLWRLFFLICVVILLIRMIKGMVTKKAKRNAIQNLREKIIMCINETPSTTYKLSSLYGNAAASCFPASYSWHGVWFELDLKNQELYADMGTYPNQFGACREDSCSLTAYEFHRKAVRFNMSKELQCMETEADWQELFDADLKEAVANASKILDAQMEEQRQRQRILHAIVIPDKFAMIKPAMSFDEIRLELRQSYGSSDVWLIKESGKYVLEYRYFATYSWRSENSQRELSPVEAAWLETLVNACIVDQDNTTWQSLPGGDLMSVRICIQNKPQIEVKYETPLKKYYELYHSLETLAIYGSFLETEMKEIKK